MNLLRFFRKIKLKKEEKVLLIEFEKQIGYVFKDISLLKKALSHKSYVNEKRLQANKHNERLEFLGDAVLELGISDMLFQYFPQHREGAMSKIRASLVNEVALAEQARKIDLGKYLFLGKGEEQCQGREKDSLLSDAYEAVLGAIYLDGGFQNAFKVIRAFFDSELKRSATEDISRDYKTKLQEEVQNLYKESPEYRLVNEIGPDHAKVFEVHVYVQGQQIGEGEGRSKKQAEQNAAQSALEQILTEES